MSASRSQRRSGRKTPNGWWGRPRSRENAMSPTQLIDTLFAGGFAAAPEAAGAAHVAAAIRRRAIPARRTGGEASGWRGPARRAGAPR
jgi:hypothetical protein